MQKLYAKIAKRLGINSNAVHLVHYVIRSMKDGYIAPPSDTNRKISVYTAHHICAAVLAYLRLQYAPHPLTALRKFGLTSSEDIGAVVEALAESNKAGMPKLKDQEYDGLFTDSSIPEAFHRARWYDSRIEDTEPEEETTCHLLKKHFGDVPLDSLIIAKRLFPNHVMADLQIALNDALSDQDHIQLVGLNRKNNYEGLDFTSLLMADHHYAVTVAPLIYRDMDIGNGETIGCLSNGLWMGLNEADNMPYAVVLGSTAGYRATPGLSIEIAVPDSPAGNELSEGFVRDLERYIENSKCYRGKVLSFEHSSDYHGVATGIKVHELNPVAREQVILPKSTLDLLDRNTVDFIDKRPLLAKRGMNLKKGLLFYGPPGTGKTHTLHYLAHLMKEHTTLLISAEQVGLLGEYMTLARLLQPSMVILEDVDLIARARDDMGVCEEILLNKLLNEMDGLKPDSEIFFILTTNRPETLESALTARPGRVDQAIEFPLPDEDGRARLTRLYAGSQPVTDEVVEKVVRKTEKTSAAFVKELMRRATQYAVTREENSPICNEDIELVVEEMLFSGGSLNRKILGAGDAD